MWFVEDAWSPAIISGMGMLAGLAWWSSSKRVWPLAVAVGCCLLAGAGFLIDALVVTDRERVEELTRGLVQDFRHRRPDGREHFSSTAPELAALYDAALQLVQVDEDVAVTDVSTRVTNEGSRATIHFRANADLSVSGIGKVGRQPVRLELTWARESEGWKVVRVRRLHPINGTELAVLDQRGS
jgi:hypothetical protein